MKRLLLITMLLCSLTLVAQNDNKTNYVLKADVSYISSSEKDAYRKERCVLDVYYPEGKKDFPTVVWFHGGGLEMGSKHIPEELKGKGFAIVAVNYRLNPRAENPAYTEDAAEAVAWTFKNIASYGGDPREIYVTGHSAGGYLALMVGLDKSYLKKFDIDADSIRALIPISGQTNTHYTIKKERGLPMEIPLIDKYAPLNQARTGLPPTLLITGDRKMEIPARYEENAHLAAILKELKNKEVVLYEIEGFNHGEVCVPAYALIERWVRKYSKMK